MSKLREPCDLAQLVANLRPAIPEERCNGVIPLDCCVQGCGVEIYDSVRMVGSIEWFDAAHPNRCWEWRLGIVIVGQGYNARLDLSWAPMLKEIPNFAFGLAHRLFHGWNPKHNHLVHSCGNDLCINPNHIKVADRKYPVR